MRVAYIAGPYRSKIGPQGVIEKTTGPYGIVENIQAAEKVALKYWRLGYAVICPHKNTALFDGAAPDNVWLAGDLEMLRRCDTIVAMPGWKFSSGATAEVELAISLGLEIIFEEAA